MKIKNTNKAKLGNDNITMRKDGRYQARIVRNGERLQKTSTDIRVVQEWLEQQRGEMAAEQHLDSLRQMGIIATCDVPKAEESFNTIEDGYSPTMTVDELFVKWIWVKEFDSGRTPSPNTLRNNRERYTINVQPVIGKMRLCDVTCEHTKRVFTKMKPKYKESTMLQTYITLGSMLKFATIKHLIPEVPLKPLELSGRNKKEARYLTVDEERKFLEAAEGTTNYRACRFILETGLRCSEMIGLKFSDVDWNENSPTITVKRQLEYRHSTKEWRWSSQLKTVNSYRTILLSPVAFQILKECRDDNTRNIRNTPQEFRDLVFLNKKGMPNKNSSYDTYLYKICDNAGIEHFSIHKLRHTFATRALEAGCSYKWLADTLGHNDINTTLMTYCHVASEVNKAEAAKLAEYHRKQVDSCESA